MVTKPQTALTHPCNPHPLAFTPLYPPLLLSGGGPSDLLITKRTQQRNEISHPWLYHILKTCQTADSLDSLFLQWLSRIKWLCWKTTWWWASVQELGAAYSWQPAAKYTIIFNTARKTNSTNSLRGAWKVFPSLSSQESPCETQPGWCVCETLLSCAQTPDSKMQ